MGKAGAPGVTGTIDRDRLERVLGHPDLAWLVDRVRRRLATREPLTGSVTLTDATPAQRAAVGRLLGRPAGSGRSLAVSLGRVDEVLRRSGICSGGLVGAVVELTGSVPDRAAERAALEERWRQAFAPLEQAVDGRSELREWYAGLWRTGLVRRLAPDPGDAAVLLQRLSRVVAALPTRGELLGAFAARTAGGAHALNDDQPLATLALGAARAMAVPGLPEATGAEARREIWAAVGVLRDELSTTVLTLGLPGDAETPTGRALGAWREVGQPVVLTLRQVVRHPPAAIPPEIFVCENPGVVSAAAERLGRTCRPLVCTSGQPGTAVLQLLRRYADAGATLRYHGDFDWGGLKIGNVVFDRLPAHGWRFDAATYGAAIRRGAGSRLNDGRVEASWDPLLADAMSETGLAVEEEVVADDLLDDLAR